MIKILAIAKTEINDLCSSLTNNGFSLELISAEKTTMAQLRCISYAMVLCERKALENQDVKTFLNNQNAPVMWIIHPEDLPTPIRNFRMGLEDYIVIPVEAAELLARIHMLMRCAGIDTGRKLTVGTLFMDADARIAIADGQEIQLTMREFDLIFGLLSAPEKAFTRKELMQKYWDEDSTTSPRAVDVYMTKLREKFSPCHSFQIVTVHGVGYKAVLQNV